MPMRTKASTGKIRQTYEFIKANRNRFDVRTMCRVLEVAPSGYYAWLQEPACQRALEDVRLLRLITCQAAPFGRGASQAEMAFLALRSSTFCKATITSNMGLCWHSLGLTMPENTCSSRRSYAWQTPLIRP